MNKKINIVLVILIGAISLLLNNLNIKVECPFYFLFHIPCPGCGLTRAVKELINLNIEGAIRYNFLSIPLTVLFVMYIGAILIKKEEKVDHFIEKNKNIIILLSIILFIIVFLININNKNLYY